MEQQEQLILSPEFEFNPFNSNFSHSTILPADQLFAGGILLPFHLRPDPLTLEPTNPKTNPDPEKETPPKPDPGPELSSLSSNSSHSHILPADQLFADGVLRQDPLTLEPTNPNLNTDPEKETAPEPDPGPELSLLSSNLFHSTILPADQLFAGGELLPFHLCPDPFTLEPTNRKINPDPEKETAPKPDPESELSSLSSLTTTLTSSKRWTDFFKTDRKTKSDHKNHEDGKNIDKKKEIRGRTGNGTSFAELNINLWPFSRSRSAGNGGSRPRVVAGRKVSSAPCSRSNSGGELKSRKWPASPARGGVHLGRSSPVWQVRHGGGKVPVAGGGEGSKVTALNVNVPVCVGYRKSLNCKNGVVVTSCDHTDVARKNGGGGSGDGGRGGNMFNLRSIFGKKVY